MSLRARVGRHNNTGRQCQNWADDQRTVIKLLNAVPAVQGGAGGSLGGRIVVGIASEALCQAILRFEEWYFPGQRSGFIDPGGPMWRRLVGELPVGREFHIVKHVDKASPVLFTNTTVGTGF